MVLVKSASHRSLGCASLNPFWSSPAEWLSHRVGTAPLQSSWAACNLFQAVPSQWWRIPVSQLSLERWGKECDHCIPLQLQKWVSGENLETRELEFIDDGPGEWPQTVTINRDWQYLKSEGFSLTAVCLSTTPSRTSLHELTIGDCILSKSSIINLVLFSGTEVVKFDIYDRISQSLPHYTFQLSSHAYPFCKQIEKLHHCVAKPLEAGHLSPSP